MTACTQWSDELLDHALGMPAAAGLEDHLRDCQYCAGEIVRLRARAAQLDEGLRTMAASWPPQGLADRVLSQLSPPIPIWKTVAALASLVLVSFVAVWRSRPHVETVPPAVVELSHWRSPTASLLKSPLDARLNAMPRFGEY